MAPLFPAEARAALDVFGALRAVDVTGSPTLIEISRPWLLDFVAAVFGAYNPETGRRLIREFFLLVSKKNAKSTNAAGIMMTALLLNWRQSGEFGILAPTIEVANNAFRPARDMVRADEELSALLHVQEHIKTITHRETGATLQVVAADSETVAGKKWIVTLVDELWLFGKKPNADKMLLEATGGMASRPEGFVIYSSTQSDEPPAGVFRQKLMYARGVRDGRIVDPEFMPLIYEFPPAMVESRAYMDPANFYVTNPNLGASVDAAYIERKLKEAQEGTADDDTLQGVLAKHLNVEIGLALLSDRWVGADYWLSCATQVTLDDILQRCDCITVGIDGGGLDDMLGLAVLGRGPETGDWLLWSHAWLHPIALERRKSEAARYRDFAKQGDLTIVDAIGQDVEQVVEIVQRCGETGLLDKIGVDPVGIGSIVEAIEAIGIAQERIVGISQGWRLNGAIKTTERRLAEGTIKHGGAPLMAWCVGNARVEPKGNAVTITKQAAGFAKIDPLMGLFNAVHLMALNPSRARASVYEQLAREAVQTSSIAPAINADDPLALNRLQRQAMQYVDKTAGQAMLADFTDDFEPIGERLWDDLAAAGLVDLDSAGAVRLSAAGVAALATELEESAT